MSLKTELKSVSDNLVLLPTGLYRMDNRKIAESESLALELLHSFGTGSTLRILSHPGLMGKYCASHFQLVAGEGSVAFTMPSDLKLSIESVKADLLQLSFDTGKHPYANYLEAVMMQLYIDGMAMGKKLSGGVWMSSQYSGNSASVNQLELMIQLRNDSIYAVSDILKTYPKEFTMSFDKFELSPYQANNSQYMTWMEYRILQIRHKNLLQEIAVQSKILGAEEKAVIEQEIKRVEALKQSYPVTIEG